MAVEIKYVVVREGEEKMSFANKKDADAYDKMLDLAEVLGDWLQQSPVELDPAQFEAMGMWLAERKDILSGVLKTGQLPAEPVDTDADANNVTPHPGSKKVA